MIENAILVFKIVKDRGSSGTPYVQGPHETLRSSHFVYGCVYEVHKWISYASSRQKREPLRFRVSQVV